jgi:Raf kinase inhibitor-like YbhB/YbcL family protein
MSRTRLTLTSPSFQEGQFIPTRHTCDGSDVSPELSWSHAPEGTASYTLVVEDLDAPDGSFTHWVLFDIPRTVESLPEDVKGVGVGGRNDFQHERYAGPCPLPNRGAHRYLFRLCALDVESLGLSQGATREEVEETMSPYVLEEARLVGRFQRGNEPR